MEVQMLTVVSRRLGTSLCVDEWLERKACTKRTLNCATGGTGQIAELVRSTDNKSPEGSGRQFHQMDGNHTPCALHAELLEEGSGDDGFAGRECVGVKQGTTNGADDDDGEAAAELLGEVAYDCAAGHCARTRLA